MNRKKAILQGTFILTVTGIITKLMGFYYRIFLSNKIGAEQLGIYQLIFPLLALAFSVTSSGISLVISRQVAAGSCLTGYASCRDNQKCKDDAPLSQHNDCKSNEDSKSRKSAAHQAACTSSKQILAAGLIASLFLSFCVSYVFYKYAGVLSRSFLGEERCIPLLRAASFCIPLSSIHACVEGYYFGLRKTTVPAMASLAEQIVRVFSVWLICQIAIAEGRSLTVEIAVYGLILGEAASSLVCLTALSLGERSRSVFSFSCVRSVFLALFKQGIPLTANKIVLNLLQSLEAVLIPARLQLSGLNAAESLTVYGVLTGMAMPFIMFPSTLTNSASMMLMPTVAQAQADHQEQTLKRAAQYTLKFCLLLGIFCTGIFIVFGHEIGTTVFNNEMAGRFLCILGWICPLLYISSTFGSILHGLGKTQYVFFISLSSVLLRILCVLFLIPAYGILGYLWGMLACHMLMAAAYTVLLHQLAGLCFSVTSYLLKPTAAAGISCSVAYMLLSCMKFVSLIPLIVILALCGIIYLVLIITMGCLTTSSTNQLI